MAQITLEELLGAGATQTATAITIPKANLDITATASNGGEQIAAGLMKKMKGSLTKARWDAEPTADVYIESGTPSTAFRTIGTSNETLADLTYVAHFTQPQVEPEIDPNQY